MVVHRAPAFRCVSMQGSGTGQLSPAQSPEHNNLHSGKQQPCSLVAVGSSQLSPASAHVVRVARGSTHREPVACEDANRMVRPIACHRGQLSRAGQSDLYANCSTKEEAVKIDGENSDLQLRKTSTPSSIQIGKRPGGIFTPTLMQAAMQKLQSAPDRFRENLGVLTESKTQDRTKEFVAFHTDAALKQLRDGPEINPDAPAPGWLHEAMSKLQGGQILANVADSITSDSRVEQKLEKPIQDEQCPTSSSMRTQADTVVPDSACVYWPRHKQTITNAGVAQRIFPNKPDGGADNVHARIYLGWQRPGIERDDAYQSTAAGDAGHGTISQGMQKDDRLCDIHEQGDASHNINRLGLPPAHAAKTMNDAVSQAAITVEQSSSEITEAGQHQIHSCGGLQADAATSACQTASRVATEAGAEPRIVRQASLDATVAAGDSHADTNHAVDKAAGQSAIVARTSPEETAQSAQNVVLSANGLPADTATNAPGASSWVTVAVAKVPHVATHASTGATSGAIKSPEEADAETVSSAAGPAAISARGSLKENIIVAHSPILSGRVLSPDAAKNCGTASQASVVVGKDWHAAEHASNGVVFAAGRSLANAAPTLGDAAGPAASLSVEAAPPKRQTAKSAMLSVKSSLPDAAKTAGGVFSEEAVAVAKEPDAAAKGGEDIRLAACWSPVDTAQSAHDAASDANTASENIPLSVETSHADVAYNAGRTASRGSITLAEEARAAVSITKDTVLAASWPPADAVRAANDAIGRPVGVVGQTSKELAQPAQHAVRSVRSSPADAAKQVAASLDAVVVRKLPHAAAWANNEAVVAAGDLPAHAAYVTGDSTEQSATAAGTLDDEFVKATPNVALLARGSPSGTAVNAAGASSQMALATMHASKNLLEPAAGLRAKALRAADDEERHVVTAGGKASEIDEEVTIRTAVIAVGYSSPGAAGRSWAASQAAIATATGRHAPSQTKQGGVLATSGLPVDTIGAAAAGEARSAGDGPLRTNLADGAAQPIRDVFLSSGASPTNATGAACESAAQAAIDGTSPKSIAKATQHAVYSFQDSKAGGGEDARWAASPGSMAVRKRPLTAFRASKNAVFAADTPSADFDRPACNTAGQETTEIGHSLGKTPNEAQSVMFSVRGSPADAANSSRWAASREGVAIATEPRVSLRAAPLRATLAVREEQIVAMHLDAAHWSGDVAGLAADVVEESPKEDAKPARGGAHSTGVSINATTYACGPTSWGASASEKESHTAAQAANDIFLIAGTPLGDADHIARNTVRSLPRISEAAQNVVDSGRTANLIGQLPEEVDQTAQHAICFASGSSAAVAQQADEATSPAAVAVRMEPHATSQTSQDAVVASRDSHSDVIHAAAQSGMASLVEALRKTSERPEQAAIAVGKSHEEVDLDMAKNSVLAGHQSLVACQLSLAAGTGCYVLIQASENDVSATGMSPANEGHVVRDAAGQASLNAALSAGGSQADAQSMVRSLGDYASYLAENVGEAASRATIAPHQKHRVESHTCKTFVLTAGLPLGGAALSAVDAARQNIIAFDKSLQEIPDADRNAVRSTRFSPVEAAGSSSGEASSAGIATVAILTDPRTASQASSEVVLVSSNSSAGPVCAAYDAARQAAIAAGTSPTTVVQAAQKTLFAARGSSADAGKNIGAVPQEVIAEVKEPHATMLTQQGVSLVASGSLAVATYAVGDSTMQEVSPIKMAPEEAARTTVMAHSSTVSVTDEGRNASAAVSRAVFAVREDQDAAMHADAAHAPDDVEGLAADAVAETPKEHVELARGGVRSASLSTSASKYVCVTASRGASARGNESPTAAQATKYDILAASTRLGDAPHVARNAGRQAYIAAVNTPPEISEAAQKAVHSGSISIEDVAEYLCGAASCAVIGIATESVGAVQTNHDSVLPANVSRAEAIHAATDTAAAGSFDQVGSCLTSKPNRIVDECSSEIHDEIYGHICGAAVDIFDAVEAFLCEIPENELERIYSQEWNTPPSASDYWRKLRASVETCNTWKALLLERQCFEAESSYVDSRNAENIACKRWQQVRAEFLAIGMLKSLLDDVRLQTVELFEDSWGGESDATGRWRKVRADFIAGSKLKDLLHCLRCHHTEQLYDEDWNVEMGAKERWRQVHSEMIAGAVLKHLLDDVRCHQTEHLYDESWKADVNTKERWRKMRSEFHAGSCLKDLLHCVRCNEAETCYDRVWRVEMSAEERWRKVYSKMIAGFALKQLFHDVRCNQTEHLNDESWHADVGFKEHWRKVRSEFHAGCHLKALLPSVGCHHTETCYDGVWSFETGATKRWRILCSEVSAGASLKHLLHEVRCHQTEHLYDESWKADTNAREGWRKVRSNFHAGSRLKDLLHCIRCHHTETFYDKDWKVEMCAKERWRKVHSEMIAGAALKHLLDDVRCHQAEHLYDESWNADTSARERWRKLRSLFHAGNHLRDLLHCVRCHDTETFYEDWKVKLGAKERWRTVHSEIVAGAVLKHLLHDVRCQQTEHLYDESWKLRVGSKERWRKIRTEIDAASALKDLLHDVRRHQTENIYEHNWTVRSSAKEHWRKLRSVIGARVALKTILHGVRCQQTETLSEDDWNSNPSGVGSAVKILLHDVRGRQTERLYAEDWSATVAADGVMALAKAGAVQPG